MPYIPPKNRPGIDQCVNALADAMAAEVTRTKATAEISELYRRTFDTLSSYITAHAQPRTTTVTIGVVGAPLSVTERLGQAVLDAAKGYNQKGGFLGELNYAITTLIQAVPHKLVKNHVWDEAMRYWLYAQTVGALTRTAYDQHAKHGNNWISNGLAGVFEDVKDEYKRRVNTAYEAAQITKSGDCFSMAPYRTQLVETEVAGVKGYMEVMLPRQEPAPAPAPAPKA